MNCITIGLLIAAIGLMFLLAGALDARDNAAVNRREGWWE